MKTRTVVVTRRESGRTAAAILRERLGWPAPALERLFKAGRIRTGRSTCRNSGQRLHAGQRIDILPPVRPRPPNRATGLRIVFVDPHVVVVEKPAGLTTVRHAREISELASRARRFLPPTLADLLPDALRARGAGPSGRVRAVHRLDRETSGLVVFARSAEAERALGQQFRAHAVERRYLAIVRGHAQTTTISSNLVRDRGDGRRGSSKQGEGKRAVTHVRVVEELGAYTLVECRLDTGRTHQVRIHLGESGTPLCGEHVYDRTREGLIRNPDRSEFPRPALHAAQLAIVHPRTGKRIAWQSPLPKDMASLLLGLRKAK
jgi:23S rRNA pseudouridine1911/1915/1917 synthase